MIDNFLISLSPFIFCISIYENYFHVIFQKFCKTKDFVKHLQADFIIKSNCGRKVMKVRPPFYLRRKRTKIANGINVYHPEYINDFFNTSRQEQNLQ